MMTLSRQPNPETKHPVEGLSSGRIALIALPWSEKGRPSAAIAALPPISAVSDPNGT